MPGASNGGRPPGRLSAWSGLSAWSWLSPLSEGARAADGQQNSNKTYRKNQKTRSARIPKSSDTAAFHFSIGPIELLVPDAVNRENKPPPV